MEDHRTGGHLCRGDDELYSPTGTVLAAVSSDQRGCEYTVELWTGECWVLQSLYIANVEHCLEVIAMIAIIPPFISVFLALAERIHPTQEQEHMVVLPK